MSIVLRLVLFVLFKGIVFFIFGYTRKRSWFTFLAATLIPLLVLVIPLVSMDRDMVDIATKAWLLLFIVPVVLLFDCIISVLFIKEKRRLFTCLYVIVGNISGVLLTELIMLLQYQ